MVLKCGLLTSGLVHQFEVAQLCLESLITISHLEQIQPSDNHTVFIIISKLAAARGPIKLIGVSRMVGVTDLINYGKCSALDKSLLKCSYV